MRAALAVLVLAGVALTLGTVLRGAGASSVTGRSIRIAIGALLGIAAAAVTVSLALDVIPDEQEGELVDLVAVVGAAAVAAVLVIRVGIRWLR